ncbi:MAG: hypothetical protein NT051_05565 [Candidatus Micrarchaeota archaeon]|nr:hypothetical protein [Candidatus Micrarchaeota archaeon]
MILFQAVPAQKKGTYDAVGKFVSVLSLKPFDYIVIERDNAAPMVVMIKDIISPKKSGEATQLVLDDGFHDNKKVPSNMLDIHKLVIGKTSMTIQSDAVDSKSPYAGVLKEIDRTSAGGLYLVLKTGTREDRVTLGQQIYASTITGMKIKHDGTEFLK